MDLDADFVHDTERFTEAARAECPVQRVKRGSGQAWLVTRYDDIRAAMTDPALSSDLRKIPGKLPDDPMARILFTSMLHRDPPEHTRLRKLVNRSFTPAVVERLRPRLEQMAAELAAQLPRGEAFDFVDHFTLPFPLMVMAELIGIPPEDRQVFGDWSRVINSMRAPEEWQAAMKATVGYLGELIDNKRAAPTGDLLSELVQVADSSERLPADELIGMALLLVVAGHDPSVAMLTNCMHALVEAPDQANRLRREPDLRRNAVEELLRYAGPVNIPAPRFALHDSRIGDVTIPEGETVSLSMFSANRDERRFPGAAELRLDRDASGHLAFGHGIHYCVGAPLARLELDIMLTTLLPLLPATRLATDRKNLRYRDSTLFHSLASLPLFIDAQPGGEDAGGDR